MLPGIDKDTKIMLKNSKLQLWGAAVLAGLFILITQAVTSFMLAPIYAISLYAAVRYTASGFMSNERRLYYRKAAYFGLLTVVTASMLIALINPVGQYRNEGKVTPYNNSPYEYRNPSNVAPGQPLGRARS